MSLWWSVRGETFVCTGDIVVAVGSRGMLPTVWFGLVWVSLRRVAWARWPRAATVAPLTLQIIGGRGSGVSSAGQGCRH